MTFRIDYAPEDSATILQSSEVGMKKQSASGSVDSGASSKNSEKTEVITPVRKGSRIEPNDSLNPNDSSSVSEPVSPPHAISPLVTPRDWKKPYRPTRSDIELRSRRVDCVVDLMAEGKWGPAERVKLLREWACSPYTLAEYASTASEIVRRSTSEDREAIKATIIASLEAIAARNQGLGDAKHEGVAVKALEVLAKVHGAMAPQAHELTVKPISRAEALAELREEASRDPELRAALLTQGVLVESEPSDGSSPLEECEADPGDPLPP